MGCQRCHTQKETAEGSREQSEILYISCTYNFLPVLGTVLVNEHNSCFKHCRRDKEGNYCINSPHTGGHGTFHWSVYTVDCFMLQVKVRPLRLLKGNQSEAATSAGQSHSVRSSENPLDSLTPCQGNLRLHVQYGGKINAQPVRAQ